MSSSKSLESKIQKLTEVLELAIARGALAGDAPLDSHAAALYLGVAPASLAVWRSQGKGPRCTYAGTMPRYHKVDLDAWMAGGRKRRASVNAGRPPKKRGGR